MFHRVTRNHLYHIARGSALAGAGVLCLALVSFTQPVRAASNQQTAYDTKKGNIAISPAEKELVLGSGLLQATSNVVITNNTDQDLDATIRAVNFRALNENGGVTRDQAGVTAGKYSLASWVKLPEGNLVHLPRGQATTIPVVVDNRKDMAPGGHYGAIVVTTSTLPAANGSKVNLKQELVSLMFVKKIGGESYGLRLSSVKVKEAQAALPSIVSTRFASTGNVHVVPRGYITLSDPKGKIVAKGILNPESQLILPDMSRTYDTSLQTLVKSTMSGTYKVTVYYRHDGESKFTVQTLAYQKGSWLVRHKTVLIITGVICLILLLFIQLYRTKKRQ
jgi:hypothetical protein